MCCILALLSGCTRALRNPRLCIWGSIGHAFWLLPRTPELLTREKPLDLPNHMPPLNKTLSASDYFLKTQTTCTNPNKSHNYIVTVTMETIMPCCLLFCNPLEGPGIEWTGVLSVWSLLIYSHPHQVVCSAYGHSGVLLWGPLCPADLQGPRKEPPLWLQLFFSQQTLSTHP